MKQIHTHTHSEIFAKVFRMMGNVRNSRKRDILNGDRELDVGKHLQNFVQ